jgi:hypothetical protein
VADLVLARYPPNPAFPIELELGGEYPWAEDGPDGAGTRFLPFAIEWRDGRGNGLFHFNPRPAEGVVVLNSCRRRGRRVRWEEEVIVSGFPLPQEPQVPFRLRFAVRADHFAVFVEDEHFCDFPHRYPPASLRSVHSGAYFWRLEGGRALAPELASNGEVDWISAGRNGRFPRRLRAVRLFAVLSTWMEEDVVSATVANCFEQGCEGVYVVDNGSSDETVVRAVAAGAVLARSYATEQYDEDERMRLMHGVVDEVSLQSGDDHVWWLWVDADEFHHGPAGLTVRDHLETLDRRFRIVGARFFNHFPSGDPAYLEGQHPLDFQPLCYELALPRYCQLGHFKHPLQRWDRNGAAIRSNPGFHIAFCSETLLEPDEPIFAHHFPFRDEATTRAWTYRLFGVGDAEGARALTEDRTQSFRALRLRLLDAVYRGKWADLTLFPFPPHPPGYLPDLKEWPAGVSEADARVARWY